MSHCWNQPCVKCICISVLFVGMFHRLFTKQSWCHGCYGSQYGGQIVKLRFKADYQTETQVDEEHQSHTELHSEGWSSELRKDKDRV